MKGTIAFCSMGILGIITEDNPRLITYPDGNTGYAYVGIKLTEAIGEPWSSKTPRIIGHADDLIALFNII
jgi:hypothetical protein